MTQGTQHIRARTCSSSPGSPSYTSSMFIRKLLIGLLKHLVFILDAWSRHSLAVKENSWKESASWPSCLCCSRIPLPWLRNPMYLAIETLTSRCPNEFSFPLDVNQGASESTLETLPKVYIQNVLSLKAFCKFQFSHPFLEDGLRSYIYSLKIYWSRFCPTNSLRSTMVWPIRFSHPDGKVLPEHLSGKPFSLPLTNSHPNNSSSSHQVTSHLVSSS